MLGKGGGGVTSSGLRISEVDIVKFATSSSKKAEGGGIGETGAIGATGEVGGEKFKGAVFSGDIGEIGELG